MTSNPDRPWDHADPGTMWEVHGETEADGKFSQCISVAQEPHTHMTGGTVFDVIMVDGPNFLAPSESITLAMELITVYRDTPLVARNEDLQPILDAALDQHTTEAVNDYIAEDERVNEILGRYELDDPSSIVATEADVWAEDDPVLSNGAYGVDLSSSIVKRGDGERRWSQLPTQPEKTP